MKFDSEHLCHETWERLDSKNDNGREVEVDAPSAAIVTIQD